MSDERPFVGLRSPPFVPPFVPQGKQGKLATTEGARASPYQPTWPPIVSFVLSY